MIAETAPTHLRLAADAAGRFLLDLVEIGRVGREPLDVLIEAEVLRANASGMKGDVRLQQMYATFYAPPPDGARRPVLVPTVARTLGLPTTTVRARATRLAGEGVFDLSRRGVLFSQRALRSAEHREILERVYEATRGLYLKLQAAGALQGMALQAGRPGAPRPQAPPHRMVMRAVVEFFTAALGAMGAGVGGPTRALARLEQGHGETEAVRGALYAALAEMLATLAELGVLALWDAEAGASQAAA